ncbi:lysine exporter LysO family protein [Desulfobotulus sp. H1]|uniref:Lysine exporter LysO family protein n=1 Tax=Desulfobotulus pelophilus TaxID=2823377 RepID=A0ABT3N4W3_9BACT|nr:lysine exporter LysO family protein [Desulfobotulus pelophilus]MCW7752496.1 lysine exporter LysO family protein [Desulfobotulus pelophilus]
MGSLKIIAAFILGLTAALFLPFSHTIPAEQLSLAALYLLLFLVGAGIGSKKETMSMVRRIRPTLLLLPLAIATGSILFPGMVAALFLPLTFQEGAAIGAGLGYYSLSSILISQMAGETLGLIALLSNIIREIVALTATPLLVRYCGRFSGIAAGGATAMDTTLPVIVRFTGKEYALVALFSGVILTFLTPVLVTSILSCGA